jgi:WD40 repeat protein
VFDSIKDFQIVVEDMVIPHKLKIKQNAHRKNITSMKFNSFGTNVITTGMDGFIRIWDANKSILY